MAEVIPSKRQAVERFQQRLQNYRRHSNDCVRRYQNTFDGLIEQDVDQTLYLKQKFIQSKEKRTAKKKLPDNQNQNGSMGYFQKKREDDIDGPSPKIPKLSDDRIGNGMVASSKTNSNNTSGGCGNDGLTKFSVEIVQQLEFTTNTTNSQISTNVTVKALNTSMKSDADNKSSPLPNQNVNTCNSSGGSTVSGAPAPSPNVGTQTTLASSIQRLEETCLLQQGQSSSLSSCKQEKEYVDLADLQLAIEKDYIPFDLSDDVGDTIISQDAIKALISDIISDPKDNKDIPMHHQLPMQSQLHQHQMIHQQLQQQQQTMQQQQFHQEDINKGNGMKGQQSMAGHRQHNQFHMQQQHISHAQQQSSQQQQQQQLLNAPKLSPNNANRVAFGNQSTASGGYNPAAQTLKQMAEQHNKQNLTAVNYRPQSPAVSHLKTQQQPSSFPDYHMQYNCNGSGGGGLPINSSTNMNQMGNKQQTPVNSSNSCCVGSQTVNGNPGLVTPPPNSSFINVDSIKQEVMYSSNSNSPIGYSPGASSLPGKQSCQGRSQRNTPPIFKQQPYSPYDSPSNHSSPQYPPRAGPGAGPSPVSPKTPSAPPSSTTLQINQAQQVHINQTPGKSIQVSMAQNVSTEMASPSVSVAAHQGMYFMNQQTSNAKNVGSAGGNVCNSSGKPDNSNNQNYVHVSQSQTINFTHQQMKSHSSSKSNTTTPTSTTSSGPLSNMGNNLTPEQQHIKLLQQQQQQQMLRTQMFRQQHPTTNQHPTHNIQPAQQSSNLQQQQQQQQQQQLPPLQRQFRQQMQHQQQIQPQHQPSPHHTKQMQLQQQITMQQQQQNQHLPHQSQLIRPPPPDYNISGRQVPLNNVNNNNSGSMLPHMNPNLRNFSSTQFLPVNPTQRMPQSHTFQSSNNLSGNMRSLGSNIPLGCSGANSSMSSQLIHQQQPQQQQQQQQHLLQRPLLPQQVQQSGPICRPTRAAINDMLNPEWRHMLMTQQQSQIPQQQSHQQQSMCRPNFLQSQGISYTNTSSGVHMVAGQMQQMPIRHVNNGTMTEQHRQSMNIQQNNYPVAFNIQMLQSMHSCNGAEPQNNSNHMRTQANSVPTQSPAPPSYSCYSSTLPSYSNAANNRLQDSSAITSFSLTGNNPTNSINNSTTCNNIHNSNNNNNNSNNNSSTNNNCHTGNNLNSNFNTKFSSDFNFDFLDQPLTSTESSHLNDTEFLNSFNLSDLI